MNVQTDDFKALPLSARAERDRRMRVRNLCVVLVLILLAALMYAISVVRFKVH